MWNKLISTKLIADFQPIKDYYSRLFETNQGLRWFMAAFSVFLGIGLLFLIFVPYGDLVLFINQYSRMEWDLSVDWITRLGLGSTAVIVALGFAIYRLRYALMILFDLALVGIVTGLFKNVLFPHIVRPLKYFEPEAYFRMVKLFDYNLLHSFPSGHSMTIFALTSLLAYFANKSTTSVILVFSALLVAFTRLYLLQHFFVDIYVGAILGLICTFTTIWMGDYVVKLQARKTFQTPILLHQLRRSFNTFFL